LMVVTYVALVEFGKRLFFKAQRPGASLAPKMSHTHRRIRRVATRWSHRTISGRSGRRLPPTPSV
jgi:hypothetical protein